MSNKTHWYADEENGITTDGKRFYCPERNELREKWEKATRHLNYALFAYLRDLDDPRAYGQEAEIQKRIDDLKRLLCKQQSSIP